MPDIICDNVKCIYNHDHECTATEMRYLDRLCMTYRKERTKDIMQPSFRSRCHRDGGKYKSDKGRVIK